MSTSTSQRLAHRLSIPAVTLSLLAGAALVPGAAVRQFPKRFR